MDRFPFVARSSLRLAAPALALGLSFSLFGPVEARAQQGVAPGAASHVAAADLDGEIAAIREATARFLDVEVALAEGYMRDPMNLCVTAPEEGYPRQLGGMGIHFFRPDLLGITATEPRVAGTGTHTDFHQPGVLVYFPGEDGKLRLGAVENLIFKEGWSTAGHGEPPSYLGQEYWRMVDNPATPDVDEAHMFDPHYELHLWVHEENPLGVAFPFNPRVSCEHHDGPKTMAEGMEWMKAHAPAGGHEHP